jgi:hypothetical protein
MSISIPSKNFLTSLTETVSITVKCFIKPTPLIVTVPLLTNGELGDLFALYLLKEISSFLIL